MKPHIHFRWELGYIAWLILGAAILFIIVFYADEDAHKATARAVVITWAFMNVDRWISTKARLKSPFYLL